MLAGSGRPVRRYCAPLPRIARALAVNARLALSLGAHVRHRRRSALDPLPEQHVDGHAAPPCPTGRSDDHLLIPESPPGDDQGHPAWSPNGTTIGFEAWLGLPDPTPKVELWTVGVDGTDLQRLASCDLPCLQLAYPAWSPDGTRVALMRYEVEPDESWGRSAVEILDLATRTREVVTETADGTAAHYVPHWSPDGDRLVVIVQTYADATQQTVLSSSAAVLDAKPGSTPRAITPDGLFVDHAEWAPGEDIILTAGDSKESLPSTARVMMIAPDGTGLREIAPRGERGTIAFDATWIDGGERVMFVSAGPASPEHIALVEPRDGTIQHVTWALRTTPGIQRTYAQFQPTP